MKAIRVLILFSSLTPLFASGQSIRKPWRELTEDERIAYVDRINELYQNGTWDQFIEDHAVNFGNHGYYFLIWHRHFIYYMEQEMGLPLVFWDWMYEDENGVSEWTQALQLWKNSGIGVNGLFGYDLDPALESQLNRELGPNDQPAYGSMDFYVNLDWHTEFGVPGINEGLLGGPHSSGHVWIGGAMEFIPTSPTDPVFYMHHSMVDQVMQWWIDENWDGSDIYFPTDPPMGTVTGGPVVDPDEGFAREDLKVWYANYNLVELFDYEVTNTEYYEYTTGEISANSFEVPSGTSCVFHADDDYPITLKTGFRANKGSYFRASRSDIGDAPGARIARNTGSHFISDESLVTATDMSLFPNPASHVLNVRFNLQQEQRVDLTIHDLSGRMVGRPGNTLDNLSKGNHEISLDIRSLKPGTYFVKQKVGAESLTRLFVKN